MGKKTTASATKICTTCTKELDVELFRPRYTKTGGRKAVCWSCEKSIYAGPRKVQRKKYHLKSLYNITPEDLEALRVVNGGGCYICGRQDRHRDLNIDHSHKTNRLRGLLCTRCNTSIGHFEDNPALLRRAAQYLEEPARTAPKQFLMYLCGAIELGNLKCSDQEKMDKIYSKFNEMFDSVIDFYESAHYIPDKGNR